MSFLFWSFAVAMLLAAVSFIAVPLKTGKSLLATPSALIVAFVPLSAVGLYALLGSPQEMSVTHDRSRTIAGRTSAASSEQVLGSVASMVDGLRARLDNEPDDAGGWILLARSYQHLDRHADALDAYKHAQALGKTDINLEAELLGSSLSGQFVTQAADPSSPGPGLRGRVSLQASRPRLLSDALPVREIFAVTTSFSKSLRRVPGTMTSLS